MSCIQSFESSEGTTSPGPERMDISACYISRLTGLDVTTAKEPSKPCVSLSGSFAAASGSEKFVLPAPAQGLFVRSFVPTAIKALFTYIFVVISTNGGITPSFPSFPTHLYPR